MLDAIAAATTDPLLIDVAGVGQIFDDAVGAPLANSEGRSDLGKLDVGIMGDAEQSATVFREEIPFGHLDKIAEYSRNRLLVINFRRMVKLRQFGRSPGEQLGFRKP